MEELISKCVTEAAEHIELVLNKIKEQHAEVLQQQNAELESLRKELADQKRATGDETVAKDEAEKKASSQKQKVEQPDKGGSDQKKQSRSQQEKNEQLDEKDRDQENETQRLEDTVASENKSIAQPKDEVKKEKEKAKPASAVQDGKIESLKNNVADQNGAAEKESTPKNGAAESPSTHKQRRSEQTEKITGLHETITSKNESSTRSKRALEHEKGSVTARQQDARQAQQPGTPPPSPSQTSESFNVELRQARLLSLNLTSTAGSPISPSLQQALVHSDKQRASCLLAAEAQVGAPALHMAALFGDVELAKFLIARGAAVNEPCDAHSEKPGRFVHGVTPMHLAIATQNEEMIHYLHHTGGRFTRPHLRHQRTTAPPLWLVSSRWLNMFGEDAAKVVGILKLLKGLGWNKEDKLNRKHENMRTIVQRELKGRTVLQKAILAEL